MVRMESEMQQIYRAIEQLAQYGIYNGLIEKEDKIFVINQLLELLQLPGYEPQPEIDAALPSLPEILEVLVQYAVEQGITLNDGITARDLFDTKLMGVLTPRPSQVIRSFWEHYRRSPREATDYYYKLSGDTHYIRRDRIARDRKWVTDTPYGRLDVTINLSKLEKDPKAIAAALQQQQVSYPKCMLCKENEGYAGRMDYPARQNHRVIPLELGGTRCYLQYSPYVYYNEHCIVFQDQHIPMKICRETFVRLLDFVGQFPHYFIGSNADLPIVGGSILTHDHFQGGCYTFAMEKAPVERPVTFAGFEAVQAGIVKWPMSVLRLRAADPAQLVKLADRILRSWRGYSDASCGILASTTQPDGTVTPHNTITPIARMRDGAYELDLVLRNNRTTEQFPLGIYHPHPEYHHIKKENIGLIEVMGLAVLPARLKNEMEGMREFLRDGRSIPAQHPLAAHREWIDQLLVKYRGQLREDSVDQILQQEIGLVYAAILEQCGVFGRDEAGLAGFQRFVAQV